ncbi:MAG: hypothetical protein EAZ35_02630 [Sphingobacteriia bacterium]|nr:MAG: hypothetical protein EAZ35_02630 [Sphingobacteriia bacterium]
MITPKELLEKSDKLFFKTVSRILKGEEVFPLIIPANKKISGSNFSDFKTDLVPLYQNSKASKGRGYTVDWKEKIINGSKQRVPVKIFFETAPDFFAFIKKENEFEKINTAKQIIVKPFAILQSWANENPGLLLAYASDWPDIIKVCNYFTENKPPHNFYLRELPVEIHTKFVEDNAAIFRKLLDVLLPTEWKNVAETDFSSRYFLKKANVYTQIRILDDALKPVLGYNELSLTLDDAAWLNWVPDKVFIIENKTCFLTFPKVKNSVAIFGEGFKSRVSKHIPWLEKTNLYCWFDLDAAGFEMLNIIRQYYPNAKSFLMDESTYHQFIQYSVTSIYRKLQLNFLTQQERKLYQFLQENNKRFEQERITNRYVMEQLQDMF